MQATDRSILRELASRYAEVCADPIMDERRDLWRRHNALQRTRAPIYVRAFAWHEMPASALRCQDPALHAVEDTLRQSLFRATFADDTILEPWLAIDAAWVTPADGLWGLPVRWTGKEYGRAGVWEAPIKAPEDMDRLAEPHHIIDEAETRRRVEPLQDAIGDIVAVVVDRAPAYRMWASDISTHLAYLRGLEQIMWDMIDRPQWLHRLLAHMRDGILRAHDEAEEAGDWTLLDHQNQAMPYAEELPDPSAEGGSVPRSSLWTYCASQETTAVGPAMFDEFMLQYQIPIHEKFGLLAYGCCEDLTQKIPLLKRIPNLRRIAVAPAADVPRCAEQIGDAYVLSYRPSPADMVSYGLDDEQVADILRRDLSACRDCIVDITLKDVETVQHDPERVRHWVTIVRDVLEDLEM